MTTNPFTYGNPIRDPARFCGRRSEIRQITNRLISSARESTSIVGERRIGKTSLLYHLSNPQVADGLGLSNNRYCLVYIDFQGLTDITPHRFWQRVLHKMGLSVCDENLKPAIDALKGNESFDLFDLEDLFLDINQHGLTIVLFLDEFEYVTRNPNFGSDFFGGLRALAIHSDLALVTATRRELVELCHSEEIKGSPFFNIFSNVVLRPFNPGEVDELIDGYTQETAHAFTSDEKTLAIELGGGFPFFLQMAGCTIVEAKHQGLNGEELASWVNVEFDQQASSHYDYYWSRCLESEKITLLVILALSQQKPSAKTAPTAENLTRLHPRAQSDLRSLTRRGLVQESDGLYILPSASLERWITLEIASDPGEEETQATVDAWLTGGGWDNLKPIKGALPKFKKKYWPIVGGLFKEMSIEIAGGVAYDVLIRGLF